MGHVRGAPYHPQTQGKIERWHQTLKNRILLENYYLPGDLEANIEKFVEQSPTLPRELEQSNAGRRLLRTRLNYPAGKRKDQTQHNPKTSLAASKESRIK